MIGRLEKDRRVLAAVGGGIGVVAAASALLALLGFVAPALALAVLLIGAVAGLLLLIVRRLRFAVDRLRLTHPRAVPAGRVAELHVSPQEALRRAVPVRDLDVSTRVPSEQVPFDPEHNRLWWFVPGFGYGSGGHTTILTMVSELEQLGIASTVVISDPIEPERLVQMRDLMAAEYPPVLAPVVRRRDVATRAGDVLLATDWRSVRAVLEDRGERRAHYFVQDHEVEFTATGAMSALAADTYRAGLSAVTISAGLAQLLGERYGIHAESIPLCVNLTAYGPDNAAPSAVVTRIRAANPERLPVVAVYGRQSTARRGVELALAGLELAAQHGARFFCVLFGEDVTLDEVTFPWLCVGVQPPRELAALYRHANVGVVLSLTNPSLVPQEMLACGLPVVEADTPATRNTFETLDGCHLTAPHPERLATAIRGLLDSAVGAGRLTPPAMPTPTDAARQLAQILAGTRTVETGETRLLAGAPSITVAIPTLDPDPETFRRLLAALDAQRYPGRVELRILDSGSVPAIESLLQDCRLTVHVDRTTKDVFRHGPSRNQLVSASDTDFVVFLTHDSVPLGNRWLFDLVATCARDERIGGAFCRHEAPASAPRVAAIELLEHADRLLDVHPRPATPRTAPIGQDHHDAQFYMSNNGSILRRAAWEQVPFRDVAFGEDQLWARDALRAGWCVGYAAQASVEHLNDFDSEGHAERAAISDVWQKKYWSAKLNEQHIEARAAAALEQARRIVADYGLSDQDLAEEVAAIRARVAGWRRALAAVRANENWVLAI